jgi:hypothetical protein
MLARADRRCVRRGLPEAFLGAWLQSTRHDLSTIPLAFRLWVLPELKRKDHHSYDGIGRKKMQTVSGRKATRTGSLD